MGCFCYDAFEDAFDAKNSDELVKRLHPKYIRKTIDDNIAKPLDSSPEINPDVLSEQQ